MTPQELKASILQLAIQGKLVEQRAEEGTAAELLEEILAAKNAKGAKKNSRAETPRRRGKADAALSCEEIPNSEKPFDIPESWVWVRVEDCMSNRTGLAYNKGNLDIHAKNMVRVLRGGNINDMSYSTKPDDVMISSEFVKEDLFLRRNMIITPAVTSLDHVGKMGRIERDYADMVVGGFVLMLIPHLNNDVFSKYLLYACSSKYFRDCCRGIVNKSGQAFYNLSRGKMMELILPLPPLAEQKRIVAKIEELLPLIDRYEKAWSKLEDFNKRFPVDMQKSLLQMAIQGKLVEQRAEEGTAAELLEKILAAKNAKGAKKNSRAETQSRREKKSSALSASPREEIPDDEKPFDIPESWEWVRLSSVTDMLSGFAFKSTDFKANGKYRLLRGINLGVDDVRWKETVYVDYITERMAEYRLKSGDVLIGLDRPWISDGTRVAIFNDSKETYLVQRVLRLRETGLLTSAFIALLLRSSLLSNSIGDKTTGISVPHISPGQVGNLIIPLPPLAEQKRIVAKLEELLPLCERLK